MQSLLQSGVSNLIAGEDGQNQAAVAFEAAFDAATAGYVIVALVDTKPDGDVMRDRFKLWLAARDHAPALVKSMMFITDWKRLATGESLHAAIVDTLGSEHRDTPVLILAEISGDMLSTTPAYHWFTVARDTLALMDFDALALTCIATGPHGMPVDAAEKFPAERIYTVKSSGAAMHLTVTPVVPAGPVIRLHGKVASGGIVIVDDEETENV